MKTCTFFPLSVLLAAALATANPSSGSDRLRQVTSVLSGSNSTVTTSCSDLFSEEELTSVCEKVKSCYETKSGPCDLLLSLYGGQNADDGGKVRNKPSSSAVWGYGILCVTLISLMSVMGVAMLPFMSKNFYKSMLTALIGLAVGSLSGSAVFHLIPSAYNLGDYVDHDVYLNISLVIFGGIYMFFIIERLLKMIMEFKSRRSGVKFHGHSHNGTTTASSQLMEDGSTTPGGNSLEPIIRDPEAEASCVGIPRQKELYQDSQQAIRASFGHMDRPDANKRPTVEDVKTLSKDNPTHDPEKGTIATVAWMIIFGDGVHNFIDGLSIGAAFSESILTGLSVSLAVLCEEFPHELGDFAVLLNSGMSMKQALAYNFLSACTCYLGLVIGIVLGELHFANQYIFGLAGGMFLYIALVDMVPEMNETTDKHSQESLSSASFTFFLQNVGMLVGIFCLFFLAKYQDDIAIDL